MIAALPMYDRPEFRDATDRYWRAIRAALGYGPDNLTRDRDLWEIWRDPDLILAQTCGYPYRARLHGTVTLVGTPDFGLDGCPPGYYRSIFVARRDDPGTLADFAGRRFAYNEPLSQSGWAAPAVHFARAGLTIGERVQTGAHAQSARAVATGEADLAALDALTWRLVQRHDPAAGGLREVAATEPTPGLPYICAPGTDAEAVAAAVETAIRGLGDNDRGTLGLVGLVQIPADRYLAVETPPAP